MVPEFVSVSFSYAAHMAGIEPGVAAAGKKIWYALVASQVPAAEVFRVEMVSPGPNLRSHTFVYVAAPPFCPADVDIYCA